MASGGGDTSQHIVNPELGSAARASRWTSSASTTSGLVSKRRNVEMSKRVHSCDADFDRVYSLDGDDSIDSLLDSSAGVVQDYLDQNGLRLPPELHAHITAQCALINQGGAALRWIFCAEAVT